MNSPRTIARIQHRRRADEGLRTGPSYQTVVERDRLLPAGDLRQHHPYSEEPRPVARERFTSLEFHQLEVEKMWSRVWQFACREDEVAEPGDVVVYELTNRSVLVVRGRDDVVRAFYNTCRHRGTKLCIADSHLAEFRCPFHGFTWNLEGSLIDVPSRWDFPYLQDDEFRLHEIPADSWGGNIFINFDRNAPSLRDYLEVLPDHFTGYSDYSKKAVAAHYIKRLKCNWKAGIEAFIENYHSLETHPQTMCFNDDDNTQYDVFPNARHVSRFMIGNGVQSSHIERTLTQDEIFLSLFKFMSPGDEPPVVPQGMSARNYLAQLAREAAGAANGVDYSECSDVEILDPIQYLLFPNIIIFRGLAVPLIYRFRPDGNDPNACIFEMYIMRDLAEGEERPAPPEPFDLGDTSFGEGATALPEWLREIYDQDTQNLFLQQQGLQAGGPTDIFYSKMHESRNRHLHDTLDHYLGL